MSDRRSESPAQGFRSTADSAAAVVRFAFVDVRPYRECSGSTSAAILANATAHIVLRGRELTRGTEVGGRGDEQ